MHSPTAFLRPAAVPQGVHVFKGTFNKHARGSTDLYTFKEFPQYKVAPSPTIQLVSPTFTLAIRLEISAVGVYENIDQERPILRVQHVDVCERIGFTCTSYVECNVELATNKTYVVVPCAEKTSRPTTPWVLTLTLLDYKLVDIYKLPKFYQKELRGEWTADYNPRFLLWTHNAQKPTTAHILLFQRDLTFDTEVGIDVFRITKQTSQLLDLHNVPCHCYASADYRTRVEAACSIAVDNDKAYIIEPKTLVKRTGNFRIVVLATSSFELLTSNQVAAFGTWKREESASAETSSTWRNNPQYLLTVSESCTVNIALTYYPEKGQNKLSPPQIGFYMLPTLSGTRRLNMTDEEKTSSEYVCGFTSDFTVSQNFDLDISETSQFVIIPCQYTHGEGRFSLVVTLIQPVGTTQIDLTPLNEPVFSKTIRSQWVDYSAGGCAMYPTWVLNPQFLLSVEEDGEYTIVMNLGNVSPEKYGFYVVSASEGKERCFDIQGREIGKAHFRRGVEVVRSLHLMQGERVIIIPCTVQPNVISLFTLSVVSFCKSFEFLNLDDEYHRCSVQGMWRAEVAGGSLQYPSWRQNPHFNLSFSHLVRLNVPVVLVLTQMNTRPHEKPVPTAMFAYYSDDPDRKKLNITEKDFVLPELKTDQYSLIAETTVDASKAYGLNIVAAVQRPWLIDEDTPFRLTAFIPMSAFGGITVTPKLQDITSLSHPLTQITFRREWNEDNSHGNPQWSSWRKNTVLVLRVAEPNTNICCRMIKPSGLLAGMYILTPGNTLEKEHIIFRSKFSAKTEVVLECTLPQPGDYRIMPCTMCPYSTDKTQRGCYSIVVTADKLIEAGPGKADRGVALNELIRSEKSYVNDLLILVEKFKSPLMADPTSISSDDVALIFANAEALLRLSVSLLIDLERQVTSSDPCIGLVFLKYCPMFKIYSEYYSRAAYASILLKTNLQRPTFAALLSNLEASATQLDKTTRTLATRLSVPLKRIATYLEFVERLHFLTDPSNPDHEALFQASEQLRSILSYLEDVSNKNIGYRRLVEVDECMVNKLGDKHSLITRTRMWLKECDAYVIGDVGSVRCKLFLFNDLLLAGSPTENNRYCVELELKLAPGRPFSYVEHNPLQFKCSPHPFIFQLDTEAEVYSWVNTILEPPPKHIPLHVEHDVPIKLLAITQNVQMPLLISTPSPVISSASTPNESPTVSPKKIIKGHSRINTLEGYPPFPPAPSADASMERDERYTDFDVLESSDESTYSHRIHTSLNGSHSSRSSLDQDYFPFRRPKWTHFSAECDPIPCPPDED